MRQIDIVSKIFDKLSDDNTFIMVDPCMADNGKIYKTYTLEMADKVKKLCMKADLIVPNLTEACLLLDIPYVLNTYTSKDIFDMAKQLSNKFSADVVLTGVSLEKGSIGAVFLESENMGYAFTEKVEGSYHGTGDIFASVLISALMNGKSLDFSTQIAANFTKNCIKRTFESKKDKRYGVNFEFGIPDLIKELGDK
jgi:pyridoxine kinase